MKISRSIIILFSTVLILAGCNKSNYDDISSQIESISTMEIIEIENPFEYEDEDEEIGDAALNFGWGVNVADVTSLTYDNNRLVVPIKVTNKGQAFDIGVFVFVDGIIQPYTSNVSDEKKYIQGIEIPEDSEVEYEIYIENIELSEETEKPELAVLSVVNPDYIPNPDELMGDNHTAAGLWPFDFNMKSQPQQTEFKIISDYESHVFTDEERTRFWIRDSNIDSSAQFFLCPADSENSPDWRYLVSDNGKQQMKLYVYSTNYGSCDYRISVYKNNERVQFNDGCDYLDISSKDNFMAVADINLNDIKENDFLYCIAVPRYADRGVKKTITTVFCNENNIPENEASNWYTPSNSDVVIDYDSDYKKVEPNQIGTDMLNPFGLKK